MKENQRWVYRDYMHIIAIFGLAWKSGKMPRLGGNEALGKAQIERAALHWRYGDRIFWWWSTHVYRRLRMAGSRRNRRRRAVTTYRRESSTTAGDYGVATKRHPALCFIGFSFLLYLFYFSPVLFFFIFCLAMRERKKKREPFQCDANSSRVASLWTGSKLLAVVY